MIGPSRNFALSLALLVTYSVGLSGCGGGGGGGGESSDTGGGAGVVSPPDTPPPVVDGPSAQVPTLSYAEAPGTNGTFGLMMSVSPTTLNNNGAGITACGVKSGTTELPSWASVDPTTCVISGTPNAVLSATSYTLVATNSVGQSADASVILSVGPAVPSLSYSGASGTTGTFGVAMTVTPTTRLENGAAITSCGVKVPTTALPSWAYVNPNTCVITGTPNAALTNTTYTLVATNSAGQSADATVTLTVEATVPSLSYEGSPGTTGAVGVAMSVLPTTRLDNGASITACGRKTGTPALPSWASVNPTTCEIFGTPNAVLSATNYTIVATNKVGDSSDAVVSLAVLAVPEPPTLSYVDAAGTNGTFGQIMTVMPTTILNNGAGITACGIKIGTTALPSWASVNANTCVISGTPNVVLSATNYTIVATNSAGVSSDAVVSLSVAPGVPMLSYAGASGTNGTVGQAMSVMPTTILANGASISACGIKTGMPALPSWASVNNTTCVISGTPDAALTSTTYTLVATNSAGQSADATVTLSVGAAVPSLSYSGASGTSGTFGVAMSVTPTTLLANGAAITSCGVKVPTTALPSWAYVNPNTCVITGTPNAALPSTTYTLVATNSAGQSANATVTLTVEATVPSLSYAGAPGTTGAVGVAMSVVPTTRLDNGASITACGRKTGTPALPSWASVNATTCEITGTPDAVLSATNYTIVATNSAGVSSDAVVSLVVLPAPTVPTLSYVGASGTAGFVGELMTVTPTTLLNNRSAITACGIKTGMPALPGWASVNNTTCVISGTPDAELTSTTYTLVATNGIGISSDAVVTLSVAPPPPLSIVPSASVIHPNLVSTMSYAKFGGASGVSYNITSGSGSINSSTGVYTVDPSIRNGTTSIRVTDSANATSDATLTQIASRFGGSVNAMIVDNGFGYFGGDFTAYNPHLMSGMGKINLATGNLETGCNLAGLLSAGATVRAIAETSTDIFVGGSFTSYAGTAVQNLIKVNKITCRLDETFTQSTGIGGSGTVSVNALAISGTDLYVGGQFTTYRSTTTNAQRLAKLNTTTGNLDVTFTSATGFAGSTTSVNALAISGTDLYVGGQFTTYRGANASRIAKLNTTTGNLDTNFSKSTAATRGFNNTVNALAISGSSLYVGGLFTNYRNDTGSSTLPADRVAKVNLTSGNLDQTFSAGGGFDSTVRALTVSGSSLYAGGDFSMYRNNTAGGVAKLDLTTGDQYTTFPDAIPGEETSFNDGVFSIVVSGSSLYVGGYFDSYCSLDSDGNVSSCQVAQRLAKLDIANGSLDTSFSQSTGFSNNVVTLTTSGSSLYVGGEFSAYRGTPVGRLAKVNLSTGDLDTTFTQGSNCVGIVSALAISGSSLFVGGFPSPCSAWTLSKIDLATGGMIDPNFFPNLNNDPITGNVKSLAVVGTSLYVGGEVRRFSANTQLGLVKMDLTGNVDSNFTKSIAFGDPGTISVNALAVSGSSLYVGGNFTTYRNNAGTGTLPAQRLAKIDLTSGNLETTFTTSTGFDSTVFALAASGTSLYVGGSFSTYRSANAQRLAKLNLTNGNLDTTFTKSTGFGISGTVPSVNALAISGSFLYVGGNFTTYRNDAATGTLPAQRLAKLDLTTGNLDTTFTASTGFNGQVSSLIVSGSSLYLGGSFTAYRGTQWQNSSLYVLPVDLITGARTNEF